MLGGLAGCCRSRSDTLRFFLFVGHGSVGVLEICEPLGQEFVTLFPGAAAAAARLACEMA